MTGIKISAICAAVSAVCIGRVVEVITNDFFTGAMAAIGVVTLVAAIMVLVITEASETRAAVAKIERPSATDPAGVVGEMETTILWKHIYNDLKITAGSAEELRAKNARDAGYKLFEARREIFRVPKEGEKWDSQPLGISMSDIGLS